LDDGDGDGDKWIEEYPNRDHRAIHTGHSRSGSVPASVAPSSRTSPRDHHHHLSTSTSTSAPMLISRLVTYSPSLTLSASVREDESAWAKPDLRESMVTANSARSISGDDGDNDFDRYKQKLSSTSSSSMRFRSRMYSGSSSFK